MVIIALITLNSIITITLTTPQTCTYIPQLWNIGTGEKNKTVHIVKHSLS